jgi:hypothetical protein
MPGNPGGFSFADPDTESPLSCYKPMWQKDMARKTGAGDLTEASESLFKIRERASALVLREAGSKFHLIPFSIRNQI